MAAMFGWLSDARTLRFPLEPRKPILIRRERLWQDFDRDVALEPGVTRAVDLAHAAFAEQRGDFVGAEARLQNLGPTVKVESDSSAASAARALVNE